MQCTWRHVNLIILTYCSIFIVFFKHIFLHICANDLFFIYVPNGSACSDHFYAIMYYSLYFSGLESPNIEPRQIRNHGKEKQKEKRLVCNN